MPTKLKVLECYVFPVLTYGSECWTISRAMEKRINATEMWLLRRMMKISWTSHTSNEEVITRSGYRRNKLLQSIQKGQMKFFCHIMRKGRVENVIVTGKIAGSRDRGRQRLTFVKYLSQLMNVPCYKILHCTRDRDLLRFMVANVLKG